MVAAQLAVANYDEITQIEQPKLRALLKTAEPFANGLLHTYYKDEDGIGFEFIIDPNAGPGFKVNGETQTLFRGEMNKSDGFLKAYQDYGHLIGNDEKAIYIAGIKCKQIEKRFFDELRKHFGTMLYRPTVHDLKEYCNTWLSFPNDITEEKKEEIKKKSTLI